MNVSAHVVEIFITGDGEHGYPSPKLCCSRSACCRPHAEREDYISPSVSGLKPTVFPPKTDRNAPFSAGAARENRPFRTILETGRFGRGGHGWRRSRAARRAHWSICTSALSRKPTARMSGFLAYPRFIHALFDGGVSPSCVCG